MWNEYHECWMIFDVLYERSQSYLILVRFGNVQKQKKYKSDFDDFDEYKKRINVSLLLLKECVWVCNLMPCCWDARKMIVFEVSEVTKWPNSWSFYTSYLIKFVTYLSFEGQYQVQIMVGWEEFEIRSRTWSDR